MESKTLSLISLSVLSLVLCLSLVSALDYTETFDNSLATATYADDLFLGDNGITWTYVDARDEGTYEINGIGMIFRDSNGKINSDTISGGIGTFSVELKKASSTDGTRQVELFINDVSKGLSDEITDDTLNTFTVSDINIEGDVVIEIRNVKDLHVIIDNIEWTDYTAVIEPEYCEYETLGDLEVNIDDIKVTGYGDDEEWLLLDEIEVSVDVINDGDWDIDDIEVEWGLYDSGSDVWAIELNDEKDFNLKDGDEDTITIEFKINTRTLDIDFDELDNDYLLVVRATGTIDDKDAGSKDGDKTCAVDTQSIEMFIESDFVIVSETNFPETVSCGQEITFTADVWNIGDSDQDDVYVVISNDELGIYEEVEIGSIDAFEDDTIEITVEIPNIVDAGRTYPLKFRVYDEDNDIYENDYDDEESLYTAYFTLEAGSCTGSASKVLVSAVLESGGQAGKPLVIRATITNTGDSLSTYSLNAAGYADWASSVELDQRIIVLDAGNSRDVLFTFDVNKDASGNQLFDIEVLSGNDLVLKQSVSVLIEKSGGFGITGGIISGDNWYLWGIGALNVILVLIIIIIAVRVARK